MIMTVWVFLCAGGNKILKDGASIIQCKWTREKNRCFVIYSNSLRFSRPVAIHGPGCKTKRQKKCCAFFQGPFSNWNNMRAENCLTFLCMYCLVWCFVRLPSFIRSASRVMRRRRDIHSNVNSRLSFRKVNTLVEFQALGSLHQNFYSSFSIHFSPHTLFSKSSIASMSSSPNCCKPIVLIMNFDAFFFLPSDASLSLPTNARV